MTLAEAIAAFRAAFDGGDYRRAFATVIAASKHASEHERDAGIAALLAPIANDHAEISGFMCVASGALVEDGGSPLVGLDTILDRLAAGADTIASAGPALAGASLDAESAPPPTELPEPTRRWIAGFKSHVRGVMARLARDPEARRRARAHPRLAEAIAALAARTRSRHVFYLVETLAMLDDEPLHVVDLTVGGHISRYRAFGVRNGFHLMAVLDLLDPVALSRKKVETVTLRHGYHPWTALRREDDAWVASPYDVLLGEPHARDVPMFEGVRTVLRATPAPQRTFGVNLFAPIHEALRASLIVEAEVRPDDARPELERMAAASERLRAPGAV